MKKIVYSFIAVLFMHNCVSAQSFSGLPVKDVTQYVKDINDTANAKTALQDLLEILSGYSGEAITSGNVIDKMSGMPFLAQDTAKVINLMTRAGVRALSVNDPRLMLATPTGTLTPGAAGISTNVVDGIAKFLVKRGKEEISEAFLTHLKEEMAKYPELKILLPQTTDFLQKINLDNYQIFLQELKDVFTKDMLKMPADMLSLRDVDTLVACDRIDRACNTRLAAIRYHLADRGATPDPRLIVLPLLAVQGVLDGNTIIDIADQLANDVSVTGTNDDISGAIQLSAILMEAMRNDPKSKAVFADQAALKVVFSNSNNLRAFLGLTYAQYSRNPAYAGMKIGGHNFKDIFSDILTAGNAFYSGIAAVNQVNVSYNTIQMQIANGQKVDAANVATLMSASLNLLNNFTTTIYKTVPVDPAVLAKYQKFAKNVQNGIDIYNDVQQKNYAGIFTSTIKLIEDNDLLNGKVNEQVVKYLAFGANLASASSSDEVSAAIETIALPPGSYSIKQKSKYNIALNGYIGYALDFTDKGLYANGIYAPVGFTFSTSARHCRWSYSIFASVIDVGGVASYRVLKSGTDDMKQEVRLESVISPSVQFVLGIPRWPLAVCAGWRLTPRLFYSNDNTFVAETPHNVFNLGVLIDIPIITLYNKQRG